MARGPKPQPAAVKRQKASGRRRIVDETVEAGGQVEAVPPPEFVREDAAALALWRARAGQVAEAKLLSKIDATAFGRYCVTLSRWIKCAKVVREKGESYEIETASGVVIRSRPEAMRLDALELRLVALEDRFGLNPAERQRIYAARAVRPEAGDLFAPTSDRPAVSGGDEPAAAAPLVGLLN